MKLEISICASAPVGALVVAEGVDEGDESTVGLTAGVVRAVGKDGMGDGVLAAAALVAGLGDAVATGAGDMDTAVPQAAATSAASVSIKVVLYTSRLRVQ